MGQPLYVIYHYIVRIRLDLAILEYTYTVMLRLTGLSREIWRPKENCGVVEPFNNNKTISGMDKRPAVEMHITICGWP